MTKKEVTYKYIEMKLEEFRGRKKRASSQRLYLYSLSTDTQSIEGLNNARTPQSKAGTPKNLNEKSITWKRKMYTVNSRYESSTKFKSKSMKAKVVLTEPDYVECLSPGKANLLSLWRSRIEKNNM